MFQNNPWSVLSVQSAGSTRISLHLTAMKLLRPSHKYDVEAEAVGVGIGLHMHLEWVGASGHPDPYMGVLAHYT